jgi:two-component system CheB/CheR fusion protein
MTCQHSFFKSTYSQYQGKFAIRNRDAMTGKKKDIRQQKKIRTSSSESAPPLEESGSSESGVLPGIPLQDFPIVGIGASAGGLEALSLFLENVPAKSGMAFVVVQHLDPTHKGIMVELLQRNTPMPVVQVEDGMRVAPDCVYVIPPNFDLSILRGILYLLDPTTPRGLRLPIDFFFRSLAEDLQDKSIGVILSGMGSDGTLGLRAMKEKAGVAFVQTPASAKFDGMPRSAIDAGLADIVAPVEELPRRIMAYLRTAPFVVTPDPSLEDKAQSALEKIFILLRTQTGHDFSQYKKSAVYRRIERRMGLHQIDRIVNYVRYLQENPKETELLFKELLIGVTSFFRDAAEWEHLKSWIIPNLLEGRPQGGNFRAWAAGCSTGEEVYSLAIILREALEQVKPTNSFSFLVFASDLDKDAIDKARAGFYPANITADVSPERLRRFFIQEERGYRVKKEIREMVIFATQNLIMDPPFTKLDILVCRNLLIYLAPEIQKKLFPLFHFSLNSGGILFLGSAETIGSFTDLFSPLDRKTRLYRRLDNAIGAKSVEFPASFFPAESEKPVLPMVLKTVSTLQTQVEQLLLAHYAPAAVLTNDKGDILFINGRTGAYLEPAAGKANWNIFAMAREGLHYELTVAFHKATRQKDTVILRGLEIRNNGAVQAIDVSIRPIAEPAALQGTVMIVFTEVARSVKKTAPVKTTKSGLHNVRVIELEREFEQARAELQSTREEMQTSQEELKSANEELQSTNEELQSANEELTTSKEEMQSMNEELQTVNNELQARVDELSRAANDMRNLLESTEIAILFLDEALNVRRFTSKTTQIIKLIPSDAGRPISDISSAMVYPELDEDAKEVLRTLIPIEKTVTARDGHWFLVRIIPYRTLDNRIDGLVMSFTDVTVAKTLEAELRKTKSALEERIKEQKIDLERSEAPIPAERKRGQSVNTAGTIRSRQKKGETP